LKSSTEHLISDAQGPRLFLHNVWDSGFDEIEQGRTRFDDTSEVNDEPIKPKLHDANQHTS
jgi:hypothetical protein